MNYGEGYLKNHKINTQLFQELNDIVNKLRNPGGCDWDRAQTANSLIPYFIEEVYELIDEIEKKVPEIHDFRIGIFNLFIKHTSASLTINENADQSVRNDFEYHFNKMVPEKDPNYEHTFEGDDDMPAHLKSSILGNSTVSYTHLTLPTKA